MPRMLTLSTTGGECWTNSLSKRLRKRVKLLVAMHRQRLRALWVTSGSSSSSPSRTHVDHEDLDVTERELRLADRRSQEKRTSAAAEFEHIQDSQQREDRAHMEHLQAMDEAATRMWRTCLSSAT